MLNIRRHIFRGFLIGIGIFIVVELLNFSVSGQIGDASHYLINLAYTLVFSVTIYMANAFVFVAFDQCFKSDRFSGKRIVLGFISSFILSMIIFFVLRMINSIVIEKHEMTYFLENENMGNYISYGVITLVITLSIYSAFLYKAYQENRVQEQKIIAGTASAQFESLKNQIDPHFLFNSLNVLSSLIEENPDQAQKFTTSLSKIYRYVLDQRDKELVPLAEELAFAKTYMNLLRMRFENSIFFELPDADILPEGKVVPLALQLLLENTIKHNVVSEQKPLKIRIYIENNYLVVENDLQKKEVLGGRNGVGLQNIVSRYHILTGRPVMVSDAATTFSVRIPILTKLTVSRTPIEFDEDTTYYRAKKRVEEIRGFYGNLLSYCIVIPILVIINLQTTTFHWFYFPMAGWGMGVIMHALSVFGYGSKWEERKIRQLMQQSNEQESWE